MLKFLVALGPVGGGRKAAGPRGGDLVGVEVWSADLGVIVRVGTLFDEATGAGDREIGD